MKTNLEKWLETHPNPNPKLEVPSKAELEDLHLGKMMSGRMMAQVYGVTQTQIRRWLKERGIKPRSRKEAQSGRPPRGERHWHWKGDEVGYGALHRRIEARKGKPQKCENCGTEEPGIKYEWANVSGKYLFDLDDWIRLCTRCHRRYDHDLIEVKRNF